MSLRLQSTALAGLRAGRMLARPFSAAAGEGQAKPVQQPQQQKPKPAQNQTRPQSAPQSSSSSQPLFSKLFGRPGSSQTPRQPSSQDGAQQKNPSATASKKNISDLLSKPAADGSSPQVTVSTVTSQPKRAGSPPGGRLGMFDSSDAEAAATMNRVRRNITDNLGRVSTRVGSGPQAGPQQSGAPAFDPSDIVVLPEEENVPRRFRVAPKKKPIGAPGGRGPRTLGPEGGPAQPSSFLNNRDRAGADGEDEDEVSAFERARSADEASMATENFVVLDQPLWSFIEKEMEMEEAGRPTTGKFSLHPPSDRITDWSHHDLAQSTPYEAFVFNKYVKPRRMALSRPINLSSGVSRDKVLSALQKVLNENKNHVLATARSYAQATFIEDSERKAYVAKSEAVLAAEAHIAKNSIRNISTVIEKHSQLGGARRQQALQNYANLMTISKPVGFKNIPLSFLQSVTAHQRSIDDINSEA